MFNLNKKSSQAPKKIRPVVVKTSDVQRELARVAKDYGVDVKQLDFNIFDIKTYYKNGKDELLKSNYELEFDGTDQRDILLDKDLKIKQIYEVEIFANSTKETILDNFNTSIGVNKTKCKVYLTIKKDSILTAAPNILDMLTFYINKQKIRAKLLIDLFDDPQENVISRLSSMAIANEKVVFDEDKTYLISESYEPVDTTNDKLIKHYLNKDKKDFKDENEKVDYAKRGFIKSVVEGDLLMEYVKAKDGIAGRNCHGKYIEPAKAETKHQPTFTIDSTIMKIEGEDGIQYFANNNGYVSFDEDKCSIKSELDVGGINFKTTGDISTELDSEITLNVNEEDYVKDAVGNGMKVNVRDINIKGNVGSHAIVNAEKAVVEGQTHKTAVINASEISISTHRGEANGGVVNITRLEHGVVNAEEVIVKEAFGGEINAEKITIQNCGSYVKATASKSIEIQKLNGSENIFTIDPLAKQTIKNVMLENDVEMTVLETSMKNLKKEIDKNTIIIRNSIDVFNKVKKQILNYKKNGIKVPGSFAKTYKSFIEKQEELKKLLKEYKTKDDKLKLLFCNALSYQNRIFEARVINRDKWTEHNEIVFKLIEPETRLSYKPAHGSRDKVYGLVEIENEHYEIQTLNE